MKTTASINEVKAALGGNYDAQEFIDYCNIKEIEVDLIGPNETQFPADAWLMLHGVSFAPVKYAK